MTNLRRALLPILSDNTLLDELCSLLAYAVENDVCRFEALFDIAGNAVSDLLLELWEWKLIIPVRSSKCGEWDSRILMALKRTASATSPLYEFNPCVYAELEKG